MSRKSDMMASEPESRRVASASEKSMGDSESKTRGVGGEYGLLRVGDVNNGKMSFLTLAVAEAR